MRVYTCVHTPTQTSEHTYKHHFAIYSVLLLHYYKEKVMETASLVMYPSQEISIKSNFQVDICLGYLSRSKYRMCLLQFMSRHPDHETPMENLLLKLSPPVEPLVVPGSKVISRYDAQAG